LRSSQQGWFRSVWAVLLVSWPAQRQQGCQRETGPVTSVLPDDADDMVYEHVDAEVEPNVSWPAQQQQGCQRETGPITSVLPDDADAMV
jgi:hypothetical protein